MSQVYDGSPGAVLIDTTTIAGTVGVTTVTLTPTQSGTVFICGKRAAGGVTINLPDPTISGLKYTFIMKQAAVVAQALTFTSPTANTMAGIWIGATPNVNATAQPCATVSVAFTATAQWQDKIELVSANGQWIAYGVTGVAAGIAFA